MMETLLATIISTASLGLGPNRYDWTHDFGKQNLLLLGGSVV